MRQPAHLLYHPNNPSEYDDATGARSIKNACLTKNSHKRVTVDQNARIEIEMKGADIGSFEGCKHLVKIILGKDRLATCFWPTFALLNQSQDLCVKTMFI